MEHKVYFSPRDQGTPSDLVPEEKHPSVSPGVGLVHALHDWEKYENPVEYGKTSHSHYHFPLEMGVSTLTHSSEGKGKVGTL